ncbi:AI-2E family transporter [Thermococcus profundus]|uniref:AI-2E family transporter n=1 Tax=Thermococcus profundus TaxID=49899 RepID=A0A2Z2M9U6_THEPR|nr:AI-2E family transporter [Thermococcus profundus]ASJ03117.1 AI-2E family transporter [Thermococcus profundus]
MNGKTEMIIWSAVSLLVLYLSWRTVSPLLTSLFFGVLLAYIFYPVHDRLKRRLSPEASALLLTIVMIGIGAGFLAFLTLVSLNLIRSFYTSVQDVFSWLTSLPLSGTLQNFVEGLRSQIVPKLAGYVSSFTFSVPGYALQMTIFLFTFYYSLVYGEYTTEFVLSLVPPSQRALMTEIIERVDKTLNALVRAWLLLNVAKSVLMTVGYVIFGVGDFYTAVIAGLLTFIFSFVPLLEGWMLWVAGAIYLYQEGSILGAVGISIYGAALVSPLPDYTIRPMLVARDADLDETLVFIGMLGGTWAFGLKGLILGPVILSVALVLLKEWKEVHRGLN